MKTRHGSGSGSSDDISMNGVRFKCCKVEDKPTNRTRQIGKFYNVLQQKVAISIGQYNYI